MSVYYKGIKVGKVTKIKLSKDYKYSLLKVAIFKKDFNPPKNIHAEIRVEGSAFMNIKGVNIRKYLELVYPKNPSPEVLKDGDIIEGKLSGAQRFRETLEESVKQEKFQSTYESLRKTASNAEEISKNFIIISKKLQMLLDKNQAKLNKIVQDSSVAMDNIRYISSAARNLAEILPKQPELKSMLRDIPEITKNVSSITSDINKITVNAEFRDALVKTPSKFNQFMDITGVTFGNANITLLNADKIMRRYDCIGGSMSDLLSKRFLILKMIFGRPGESFERCKTGCPPFDGTFCPQPIYIDPK